MDQDSFDRIARALGGATSRRAGLRAALGGLLGVGAGAAALATDADAKRRRDGDRAAAGKTGRRKTCKPACTNGFECVKVGRKRQCQCPTGVTCGDACCRIGQACRDGQCVAEPNPGECVAAGQHCKGVGRPCCEGRVCASGQGGEADVACYVPKTGACATTADCVYGMLCQDGRCAPPAPAGLAQPCSQAAQQLCTTPGAVCTGYTGPDAPDGSFCTLPLRMSCTGDPDCTCYHCGFVVDTAGSGGRTSANRKACCHPTGQPCVAENDCCAGLTCTDGVCGGPSCIAAGGTGCAADSDCCDGAYCDAGTCRAYPAVCDVCPPGGGCDYTSIAAAVEALDGSDPVFGNGSTIWIAPGTYTEPGIELDGETVRSLTFRRCGSTGAVLWQNQDPAAYLVYAAIDEIYSGDPGQDFTLTFIGLEFDLDRSNPTYRSRQGIYVGGGYNDDDEPLFTAKLVMRDCKADGLPTGLIWVYYITDVELYDCTFTNAELYNGQAGVGGVVQSDGSEERLNTLRTERCTFTGNTAPQGGGAIFATATAVTLVDTLVSGNTTTITTSTSNDSGGGGLWLGDYSTLNVSGTTMITNNTVPATGRTGGSGILVEKQYNPAAPRITGVSSANCTGNTPANQNCAMVVMNGSFQNVWVPVSCDTWCLPSGTALNPFDDCAACCSGCNGSKVCN